MTARSSKSNYDCLSGAERQKCDTVGKPLVPPERQPGWLGRCAKQWRPPFISCSLPTLRVGLFQPSPWPCGRPITLTKWLLLQPWRQRLQPYWSNFNPSHDFSKPSCVCVSKSPNLKTQGWKDQKKTVIWTTLKPFIVNASQIQLPNTSIQGCDITWTQRYPKNQVDIFFSALKKKKKPRLLLHCVFAGSYPGLSGRLKLKDRQIRANTHTLTGHTQHKFPRLNQIFIKFREKVSEEWNILYEQKLHAVFIKVDVVCLSLGAKGLYTQKAYRHCWLCPYTARCTCINLAGQFQW